MKHTKKKEKNSDVLLSSVFFLPFYIMRKKNFFSRKTVEGISKDFVIINSNTRTHTHTKKKKVFFYAEGAGEASKTG